MKICLINPPDISKMEEDHEYCYSSHNIPHIGLGYIASVLKANGKHVDIIECMGEQLSLQVLHKRLMSEDYDMVGISSYQYNIHNTAKIAARIKAAKPNTFVFLGGYYATLSYEYLLSNLT